MKRVQASPWRLWGVVVLTGCFYQGPDQTVDTAVPDMADPNMALPDMAADVALPDMEPAVVRGYRSHEHQPLAPSFLAVHGNRLFVGESFNLRVSAIDLDTGQFEWLVGSGLVSPPFGPSPFDTFRPRLAPAFPLRKIEAMTVDDAGNLYLAMGRHFTLVRIDGVTREATVLGHDPPVDPGQFCLPRSFLPFSMAWASGRDGPELLLAGVHILNHQADSCGDLGVYADNEPIFLRYRCIDDCTALSEPREIRLDADNREGRGAAVGIAADERDIVVSHTTGVFRLISRENWEADDGFTPKADGEQEGGCGSVDCRHLTFTPQRLYALCQNTLRTFERAEPAEPAEPAARFARFRKTCLPDEASHDALARAATAEGDLLLLGELNRGRIRRGLVVEGEKGSIGLSFRAELGSAQETHRLAAQGAPPTSRRLDQVSALATTRDGALLLVDHAQQLILRVEKPGTPEAWMTPYPVRQDEPTPVNVGWINPLAVWEDRVWAFSTRDLDPAESCATDPGSVCGEPADRIITLGGESCGSTFSGALQAPDVTDLQGGWRRPLGGAWLDDRFLVTWGDAVLAFDPETETLARWAGPVPLTADSDNAEDVWQYRKLAVVNGDVYVTAARLTPMCDATPTKIGQVFPNGDFEEIRGLEVDNQTELVGGGGHLYLVNGGADNAEEEGPMGLRRWDPMSGETELLSPLSSGHGDLDSRALLEGLAPPGDPRPGVAYGSKRLALLDNHLYFAAAGSVRRLDLTNTAGGTEVVVGQRHPPGFGPWEPASEREGDLPYRAWLTTPQGLVEDPVQAGTYWIAGGDSGRIYRADGNGVGVAFGRAFGANVSANGKRAEEVVLEDDLSDVTWVSGRLLIAQGGKLHCLNPEGQIKQLLEGPTFTGLAAAGESQFHLVSSGRYRLSVLTPRSCDIESQGAEVMLEGVVDVVPDGDGVAAVRVVGEGVEVRLPDGTERVLAGAQTGPTRPQIAKLADGRLVVSTAAALYVEAEREFVSIRLPPEAGRLACISGVTTRRGGGVAFADRCTGVLVELPIPPAAER